jgi:hypothetical protein
MANELKFRVILSALNEKYVDDKEVIAFMLAITLDLPVQETQTLWQRLPVVLFDNLTSEDLKKIKERLLFLSKLGLDFNITAKPFPQIYRTNWQIKSAGSIIACPCCGEELLVMRAQDIGIYIAAHGGKPTGATSKAEQPEKPGERTAATHPREKTPATKPDETSIRKPAEGEEELATELEEVEVLSKELEAIVAKEENFSEDIEEVGSISEEVKKVSDIEPIGGISAEFEEIEGVSAEFEKVYVEGDAIDNHIGSLSAEMEEIEGISAELDAIQAHRDILPNEAGDLTGGQATLIDSREYEMEEIEDIPAVLQKAADPAANLLEKTGQEEMAAKQDKDKNERSTEAKASDAKSPAEPKPAAKASDAKPPAESKPAAKASDAKPPAESKPAAKASDAKLPAEPKPQVDNKTVARAPAGDSTAGINFDVMINFSGKGNIQMGIQLLARLKGISQSSAANLAEQKTAIVVANNVPQQIADRIVAEFAKFKMQGRCIPARGTNKT